MSFQYLSGRRQYLLDVLQSLYDPDVVQVNPPCSVPVLDGGAVFRDCQPLQEIQQVVVVVVDDAVYRRDKKNKLTKFTLLLTLSLYASYGNFLFVIISLNQGHFQL